MSLEQLKNHISMKKLDRLYYIHGDESYLKHFYLSEMKKILFNEESVGFDFIKLDAETSSDELMNCLSTFPVIAEKKLILITDVTEKSEIPAFITKNPDILCDDAVIVFFEETCSVSKKTRDGAAFHDFLKKNAVDVTINKLDDSTLLKWIKKQCKLRNRIVSDMAAKYLIQVTGTDMFALLHECEKLSAFCDKEITTEAIDTISVKNSEINVFNITDAILKRDIRKAHKLSAFFFSNAANEAVSLCGVLFWFAGKIYKIKTLKDKGLTSSQISSELGFSESDVYRNMKLLENIDITRLDTFIDKCVEADLMIKSSPADTEAVLTSLIEELAL